jgi:hypothetical protein
MCPATIFGVRALPNIRERVNPASSKLPDPIKSEAMCEQELARQMEPTIQ